MRKQVRSDQGRSVSDRCAQQVDALLRKSRSSPLVRWVEGPFTSNRQMRRCEAARVARAARAAGRS
jgi:hypothetical protein